MPSAFSAKDNKALVAICCACQKTTPTALGRRIVAAEKLHSPRGLYSLPDESLVRYAAVAAVVLRRATI
jgi:hypothetical protein